MANGLERSSSTNVKTVTTAESNLSISKSGMIVCNMMQRCKSTTEPSEFFVSISDLGVYKGNRAEMKRYVEEFLQSFFTGLESV